MSMLWQGNVYSTSRAGLNCSEIQCIKLGAELIMSVNDKTYCSKMFQTMQVQELVTVNWDLSMCPIQLSFLPLWKELSKKVLKTTDWNADACGVQQHILGNMEME